MEKTHFSQCRLQFDLKSVIKFSAFVGACLGIMFIPFLLMMAGLSEEAANPLISIFVALLMPIISALNGAITGLVAYPIYAWHCRKYQGQVYSGIFMNADITPPEKLK